MARRNDRVFGNNSADAGSASYNPFDSDEETDRTTSLASRRSASVPTLEKYTNPFDDDHEGNDRKNHVTKRVRFQKGVPRNPFSDDEEESAPATRSKNGKLATKLENGTLFDNTEPARQCSYEETRNSNGDNEGLCAKKGERFLSQVKGRASSVGESAMRTAEKLKESSVNQAHKLRIKKSNGSSPENPISSRAKPSSNSQERDLLFGGEERPPSSTFAATRSHYRNGFRDTGGFENQTVQELENYAVYKSEETTATVNNCLKVAENIKEDATKTLATLHQQGEQITRTHIVAANIDYDLSTGEKLLGNLGGIFSKTWKPKKTRAITGPIITRDDSFKRRGNHLEQRAALGLVRSPKKNSQTTNYTLAADTPEARIELEKAKQDDALSDLSNVLDQLKDMAIDMGSEIGRQNESLDHLGDDVTELAFRVKGANARGRRLLGK